MRTNMAPTASAPKNAERAFTRQATSDPTGTCDTTYPRSVYSGYPGGCTTPGSYTAVISSPLSIKLTVGETVARYTTNQARVRSAPAIHTSRDTLERAFCIMAPHLHH